MTTDTDELDEDWEPTEIWSAIRAHVDTATADTIAAVIEPMFDRLRAELAALTDHRDVLQLQDERNLAEMDDLATERDGLAATIQRVEAVAEKLSKLGQFAEEYISAYWLVRAALSTQDDTND